MVQVLITLLANPDEPEALAAYKKQATVIRDSYGAELLFRMNAGARIVGDFAEESVRILQFPSLDHLHGWLNDPRYLEIIPLRDKGYRKVTITVLEPVG
ncbi:MAG TPA: DUF1330 domain-containing protein [Bacilli bacterium]|nr:DUF1330 domain-containing protein [Bacilli bacterium]